MTVELSEAPLVRHYRRAEEELAGWDVEISTSALDQHVVCQLTGLTYVRADEMTEYEYGEYMDAILLATQPAQMRVEGVGPWTLTPCTCCRERNCALLCTCGRECECAGGEPVVFREMTVRDYHRVAPYHVLDQYALVAMLTGGDVDDMPWAVYRTVQAAIQRSRRNPTWPRKAGR